MLLILIPIAWLAVVAFFVMLCQMAGRGDAAMLPRASAPRHHGRTPRRGLTIWEHGAAIGARAGHGLDTRLLGTARVSTHSRARAATARARARRPGCTTGS
jgi:hypothetical protein